MKPRLGFTPYVPPQIDFDHLPDAASVLRDIPYGPHERQRIDLYLPSVGTRPFPLVIYLHSGAFVGGSKSDVGITSTLQALREGVAVAAVEYRSAYDVTWPAQIFDLKTAIRHLRANSAQYGIDPKRFALWGVSAGGYIASMAAITASDPRFDCAASNDTDCSVNAVVDWGGACGRLDWIDREISENGFGRPNHCQENSPESIMMGRALSEIPELCHLASPATHVGPNVPYFLIQHGTQDGTVPIQQSQMLANAIKKAAGADRVTFTPYDVPSDHQGQWYETADMLQEAILFLREHL